MYCKFKKKCENLNFLNNVQSHVCDVENSRLEHYLLTSVNSRMISTFFEGFISQNFGTIKIHENKALTNISEFTAKKKSLLHVYYAQDDLGILFKQMLMQIIILNKMIIPLTRVRKMKP